MEKSAEEMINNDLLHNEEENEKVEETAEPNIEKSLEESLQEELEKQQAEAKKFQDQYLRALAEVENIKKRTQRDREEYIKYGNVSLIKKILPILDDLERAVDIAQRASDTDGLRKGIEMTAKSLLEMLKNEGLEVIESQGKPFDPQYHQPLTIEPSDQFPENTVIEELQRGYILHDRVIRPALVKVSGA